MQVVKVRNVNIALPLGLTLLYEDGIHRRSRGGDVIEYPGVVATVYEQPRERVLLSPERDANPFFHFMEGLWMLDGRNDVDSIAHYVKRMGKFSDDNTTLHGAYGHRWRNHFSCRDQLLEVINRLQTFPEDRRVVLTMWDPEADLLIDSLKAKDVPCNTHVYFKLRENNLDMTVCCRSNDIIWGAYGANAVHMSMLQEFIANAVDVEVGTYTQISDSYHAYHDVYSEMIDKIPPVDVYSFHHVYRDPYKCGEIKPYNKMVNTPDFDQWLYVNSKFLEVVFANPTNPQEIRPWAATSSIPGYDIDPFFIYVAEPIAIAWEHYKLFKETGVKEDFDNAVEEAKRCIAQDWRTACVQWLDRRAI